jgi:5-methylcytosine-specific restriction enzyme A
VGKAIPTESRRVVNDRDKGLCVRCRGRGSEWHHRRSRSVKDEHRHCPCNGILLCHTCHAWVHANPFEARGKGWIVSRYGDPTASQLHTARLGWIRLHCDGNYEFAHSYEEEHLHE